MNYYIDIRVLPNPEFPDSLLMNELFSQLHKALVAFSSGEIGVCFPEFNKTLGGHLRLHAFQSTLERLMNVNWIENLKEYVQVSAINMIPEKVCYRVVRRVQSKSNAERLRRRSVRKGWLTQEEADIKITDNSEKLLLLPYIQVKSQSTSQQFRLFIEHGPVMANPVAGEFSAYGLSSIATIPWF